MWPPQWSVSSYGAGEEGTLEAVQLHNASSRNLIFVVANHLGDSRKGVILQENPDHLELVYQKLQKNLGRPLTEIGDLQIDFGPSPSKYGMKQVRYQKKKRAMKVK